MVKIGIPRALAYYQYYPVWRTFFEKLGATVVSSAPTTKQMLAAGSKRVIADTCLPGKVFMGHVLSLVGNCDYVFIPVIRSVKPRVYNCAKFLGLADMTRAVIPECPPILEIDFDINKSKEKIYEDIFRMAAKLSVDRNKIKEALEESIKVNKEYRRLMSNMGLTPVDAIDVIFGKAIENIKTKENSDPIANIALIGHNYLLYDEHVNHRILHRLQGAGCRVSTPEMVPDEILQTVVNKLLGRSYWTSEEDVVGAGGYYLDARIDGVIGVTAFGCGPDSLMIDTVRRRASNLGNAPFMNLTLEEHTAEAGIITRLEAFIDMIQRRKRRTSCV